MNVVHTEPFIVIGTQNSHAPIIFTCEHATNYMPAEYDVSPADQAFLHMHWGYDIGVFDVVHDLVETLQCQGVLANFSRLLCDPNRELTSPTLFVSEVEGHSLSFNQRLDETVKKHRVKTLYDPYHQAINETLERRMQSGAKPLLVAVHSFTPDYPDSDRSMDIGVLYDLHDAPAQKLCDALTAEQFIVGDNAPYSGKAGMMYSAHVHSQQWGLESLELEIRQDHIDTPEKAKALSVRLARALESLL